MTETANSSGRRIGQIAGLCVAGQIASAELELMSWCRQADCPPEARIMLSSLLARRGAFELARETLCDQTHDPLELLTLLCLLTQASDEARGVISRLHDTFGHLPFVQRWLKLFQPTGVESTAAPSISRVEQLAGELLSEPKLPGVIRSLVVAQQHEPNESQIDLLRCAITRIAPEFQHDRRLVMICQALADLAMLTNDHDEARRWAHRGLKVDRYCASLALILSRIEDAPEVGPTAAAVLHTVNEKYPTYPDVRAALIRREHAAGQHDDARTRLANWLEREPSCQLALRLHRELEKAA